MRRGTNPTVRCDLDRSLLGADYYFTIEQGSVEYTKTNEDACCSLSEDGMTLSVELTQEETLAFAAGQPAMAQVRYCKDGEYHATNIVQLRVDDVLLEEVI